jgi:benzoyl-CoA reductase/2-hydroxyglutaryl-CoA dehydratase subunit BcrC/BadD/HgdB
MLNETDLAMYVQKIKNDPFAQISHYKEKGRMVFGYTCSYVPEELLDALGIIPVRLLGRAKEIRAADRHFQTYCCSQVRSLMEDFLNEAYHNLDGVIFVHTCDSMQCFYDILRKNFPKMFVRNINLPTLLSGEVSFRYGLAETKRFLKSMEEFVGKALREEQLEESIAVYNENRGLLDRLYSLHLNHPEKIPGRLLLQAVLASQFLDKREINQRLAMYVNSFSPSTPEDTMRKRILLVGSILLHEEIYDLADEFGAVIAHDDRCTGRRSLATKVPEPTLEGVTSRYFHRPLCPVKHSDTFARQRYIADLVQQKHIEGVIFLYLKFCDPHSFDYPDLKKSLPVPSQLIEIEQSPVYSGQLRTRIQAFIEMLSSK